MNYYYLTDLLCIEQIGPHPLFVPLFIIIYYYYTQREMCNVLVNKINTFLN